MRECDPRRHLHFIFLFCRGCVRGIRERERAHDGEDFGFQCACDRQGSEGRERVARCLVGGTQLLKATFGLFG